jgi:hypothetical protein
MKTIGGDYCYRCHKTWVQYHKIVHYMNLNAEIIQDLPLVVCRDCKIKMKRKERKLYYEWMAYKWGNIIKQL